MTEVWLEKISAYSDGELDAQVGADVAAAIERDAALRKSLAAFRKLDALAAAPLVPLLDAETGRALWAEISLRTKERQGVPSATMATWKAVGSALPHAPAVSEARWGKVWAGIHAQIQPAAPTSMPVAHSTSAALPLHADLSPLNLSTVTASVEDPERRRHGRSLWLVVGVMAAAAMILLVASPWMKIMGPVSNPPKNVETVVLPTSDDGGAQVLNDRYFMLTRHVDGVENPVVCFFLKAEGMDDNKP